jgi:predicted PP-loop superfamily ATPase
METNLKTALERVKELEGEVEYYKTVADIAEERAERAEADLKVATGQLALLKADRRYVA